MNAPAVLIIAPENGLPEQIGVCLREAGLDVRRVSDVKQGFDAGESFVPEIVLLGDHRDASDAWRVCRRLRTRSDDERPPWFLLLPVGDDEPNEAPLVTARQQAEDLARGIRCLVGGGQAAARTEPQALHVLGLEMDRRRHRTAIDGRELSLTLSEFRILWTLARHAGFVVSRKQLAAEGLRDNSCVQDRTIDVHIKSIRRKLGERADLVETVRGVGYRFRERNPAPP